MNLSYVEDGQGHPVVLIQGYTAPAAAWALTTEALVAAGYRMIAFDRRSHGESETPVFGQRMARHDRDISGLLEHLGLNDATLVGASMGGNAIWAYVDQYGPDRLRAIVIVDQTPKMLNSPDWPYGFLPVRGKQRRHILRRRRTNDWPRGKAGSSARAAEGAARRSTGLPGIRPPRR